MTGGVIVQWESGGEVFLAVHGAFDGASAWALRNAMDESEAHGFVVDLTPAVEACDFAAALLASWAKAMARLGKRVRFRAGAPEHAKILRAHGLEVLAEDGDAFAPTLAFPHPRPPAPGALA